MDNRAQLLEAAGKAINQRDFVSAHKACVTLIKQWGDDAHAYFLLGIIHIEMGQINKAISLLEKSNGITAQPRTYAYLAKCHALKGDMTAALSAVDNAPVASLERALEMDTVGVSLSRVGAHDRALPYFEKAISLSPDNPFFYYNHAVSCKFAGQFDAAREGFEKAISLKPDYYQAHFALSDLGGMTASDNHIARLSVLQEKLKDNADGGLHIGHALAKEYEAIGDYSRAFEVLNNAKAPKRKQFADIDSRFQALFDFLEQTASDSTKITGGSDSDSPIFVIGMPRSGTTLVERIISNHSQVTSGGELQDFGVAVKELTQTGSNQVLDLPTLAAAEELDFTALGERYLERTAFLREHHRHVVDKLPFNFFYVGLIRRALPHAKIVCLVRNPMDTCVGNFRQLFSINSPYYAYAYDLMNIGRFYQRFEELMTLWSAHHPEAIRLQSYEALVGNPEAEVKQLIQFCGLDWEPQCVQVETNKTPVSTASKVQVREAINARSVGRWKHYAKQTEALQQLLGVTL